MLRNSKARKSILVGLWLIYAAAVYAVAFPLSVAEPITSAFAENKIITVMPTQRLVWVPFSNFQTGPSMFCYNAIGNLFLFLPLGVLLAWGFSAQSLSAFSVVLICAGISLGIEALQFWNPGLLRNADIHDVIFNTLGGILGLTVVRWFQNSVRSKNISPFTKEHDDA